MPQRSSRRLSIYEKMMTSKMTESEVVFNKYDVEGKGYIDFYDLK